MSSTPTTRPLFAIRKQVIWLVVIFGGAVLLPTVAGIWYASHRDAEFQVLNNWHIETQAASHDAILSVDDMLLAHFSQDPAERDTTVPWNREQRSLYLRLNYFIDRIPTSHSTANLPGQSVIVERLHKIRRSVAIMREQTASRPGPFPVDALLDLRHTLEQLRLLHWQSHEEVARRHQDTQRARLSVLIPTIASLAIAGLLVSVRLLRNIRSQPARESEMISNLTTSQARYKNLVENLPYGLEELDCKGKITYCNPERCRMLGYEPGELTGRFIWEQQADPATKDELQDQLRRLIEEQPPPEPYLGRNRSKGGDELSVRVDWDYRRDTSGNLIGFLGIITNISEQERAEKALRGSENRWRRLAENSPDYILTLNRHLKIVSINRTTPGLTPEEVIGAYFPDFAPEFREIAIECMSRVLDTGAPERYDSYFDGPDGLRRRLENRVVSLPGERDHAVLLLTATDLTERRQIENRLMESEEKFRMLVESTDDWIWEMNTQGKHTYSNDVVTKILGFRKEEICQGELPDFIHPDDWRVIEQRIPDLIARGEGWTNWIVRLRHKEGGYRHLESSASPILDEHGSVVGYRGIDRDITERIHMEEELRKSLEEKETLLREIHHRVKNNLQIISSLLYFQQKGAVSEPERRRLAEVQTRLRAMATVHEQLYRAESLSRIEMRSYLTELAPQLEAPFQDDEDPDRVTVDADPLELPVDKALPLGMIVTELVTNALKHAFPNGRAGRILIRLRVLQNGCQLDVSDNGVGLPTTTDPRTATSFGMTLVRHLADGVGGKISYEHENGTTATLSISTVNDDPGPLPREPELKSPPSGGSVPAEVRNGQGLLAPTAAGDSPPG